MVTYKKYSLILLYVINFIPLFLSWSGATGISDMPAFHFLSQNFIIWISIVFMILGIVMLNKNRKTSRNLCFLGFCSFTIFVWTLPLLLKVSEKDDFLGMRPGYKWGQIISIITLIMFVLLIKWFFPKQDPIAKD